MPLKLTPDAQSRLIATRPFEARPSAVYRAHVDAQLLPKWIAAPKGWRLAHCESDPRPSGRLLYHWADDQGQSFHISGEYLEIEDGRRSLHLERMILPERGEDHRVETHFLPAGAGTLMRMVMDLPSAQIRAEMLASGMSEAMKESYRRLDQMLAEQSAAAPPPAQLGRKEQSQN